MNMGCYTVTMYSYLHASTVSAVMVAVLRQKMNYSGALVITGRVVDVKHKCKEVGVYKQTN